MKNMFTGRLGFTLIELLVAVLIIGILVAVALPKYRLAVYKTRFMGVRQWVDKIVDAQEVYYLANGQYATENLEGLDIEVPVGCSYDVKEGNEHAVLTCPDAEVKFAKSYNFVAATVTKCPGLSFQNWGCARYVRNYQHKRINYGPPATGCAPANYGGSSSEKEYANSYGITVCKAFGKEPETNSWGTVYPM